MIFILRLACRGIVTETGDIICSGAVVLTAGTFLNGLIHLGMEKHQLGGLAIPSQALATVYERSTYLWAGCGIHHVWMAEPLLGIAGNAASR